MTREVFELHVAAAKWEKSDVRKFTNKRISRKRSARVRTPRNWIK